MEYLRIVFPEKRNVIIDGVDVHMETDNVIEIESGTHIITLGGAADFQPAEQEIVINNTSVLDPMKVCFEKKE